MGLSVKVLITGATGFLGNQLVKDINVGLYDVYALSTVNSKKTLGCDLTNLEAVKAMVDLTDPDCIIHCAASVPKTSVDYHDTTANESNVVMTQNIITASKCPIVYVSSMTVYGDGHIGPISEDEICSPANSYSCSKLDCERLIKNSGRSGFACRIPGLFGVPRSSGLVYNLMECAKYERPFSQPTDIVTWAGIHVAHAAQGILSLIPKIENKFVEVNIGCSGETSINKLSDIVNNIYKSKIKIELSHPKFVFDLSRYTNISGVTPKTLRESIERFGGELDF
jgi:nucleoside-diphosphate-sugar epimerase